MSNRGATWMQRYIVPDFETRSACDLKKCGAWRYAEDPTTEVLVLRWAYSDRQDVGLWLPGMPFPPELAGAIANGDLFVPHNAAFEKAIWRRHMMPVYDWPDIPNTLWDDSMARCANLVIPQDLDMATRVLRLAEEKDVEASKFTVGLSKFDRLGYWASITPAVQRRVAEYCGQDCLAQKGLRERVGTLSPAERQVWLLDQRINERGVRLDLDLVAKMQEVVDGATAPMLDRFREITGIPKLQSPKLKEWCHERGVKIPNLQKETLASWLDADPDSEDYESLAGDEGAEQTDIPADVGEALRIKQLVGSASVKKLGRARSCVSFDGRARGLLQYHGAGPGLWAGRLLQPQNFPRGTIKAEKWEKKDPEGFIARKISAIMTGDYRHVETFVGPAVETVVSSLRHIIVASDARELVVGDFAGIQARIALAAAGQHDKTRLMASGVDVYIDLACDIFGMPKPDWSKGPEYFEPLVEAFKEDNYELRQYGKNSVLGLGFQMGAPKFLKRYCKGKDLEFSKRIVETYRKEWAPEVPKLWAGLEEAALQTVWTRTPHEAYGVLFKLEDMWMTARLPSGRKLHYFNPKPTRKEMAWSTEEDPDIRRSWSYQAKKMGKWVNVDAFGGLLTENLASGLARDLLVSAMFKAERNGLPIVLTVHDEIVSDAKPSSQTPNAVTLKQIMEDRPQWAVDMGVPVESETWSGQRYKK